MKIMLLSRKLLEQKNVCFEKSTNHLISLLLFSLNFNLISGKDYCTLREKQQWQFDNFVEPTQPLAYY